MGSRRGRSGVQHTWINRSLSWNSLLLPWIETTVDDRHERLPPSYLYPYSHSYAHPDFYTDTHPYPNTDVHTDTHPDSHPDPDTDTKANPYSHAATNQHSHPDADGRNHRHTHQRSAGGYLREGVPDGY